MKTGDRLILKFRRAQLRTALTRYERLEAEYRDSLRFLGQDHPETKRLYSKVISTLIYIRTRRDLVEEIERFEDLEGYLKSRPSEPG